MKKPKFSFTRLSAYTAYVLAVIITSMFLRTKDPQDLKMVPLVKLFVDIAQINDNNKKK
jgi:DNA phosphorothioation-dependent restriction protein DptG